jgi:hypothetical protein
MESKMQYNYLPFYNPNILLFFLALLMSSCNNSPSNATQIQAQNNDTLNADTLRSPVKNNLALKDTSIDGKYQSLSSGMNATGTRSFTLGSYLFVDSSTDSAVYFETENAEIVGGEKQIYSIKKVGDRLECYYKICICQDAVGGEGKSCPDTKDKNGEMQMVFRKVSLGLQLIWSNQNHDHIILERVKQFDFESY